MRCVVAKLACFLWQTLDVKLLAKDLANQKLDKEMLELQELGVWGLTQKTHSGTPVTIAFEGNYLASLRGACCASEAE